MSKRIFVAQSTGSSKPLPLFMKDISINKLHLTLEHTYIWKHMAYAIRLKTIYGEMRLYLHVNMNFQ